MNTSTWDNTYNKNTQQYNTASIPSIGRQILYFDTFKNYAIPRISPVPVAKAALNLSSFSAIGLTGVIAIDLTRVIGSTVSFSGVYTIKNEASFIDLRKQEEFDWRKNRNAYQRIIHLSDLEDKWDGYNAPKFSKQQVDLAITLYSHLHSYCIDKGINFGKIEPFVAPSSDGMILFEWSGKRFPKKQLEIYVSKSNQYAFEFLKTEDDSEVEGEFNLDELYPILDWLFNFDY
jgi:hypothetical protein